MKKVETVYKGNIRLDEHVMVSDPCYGLNTWCQGVVKNVLPGEYECLVEYSDEGRWGTRVSAIQVIHVDYEEYALHEEREQFEVGVDSGQAGIFNYGYYATHHNDCNERPHVDEGWYDAVCDLTYSYKANPNYEPFNYPRPDNATAEQILARWEAYNDWLDSDSSRKEIGYSDGNTIDNLGFVSSSGYGDGGYNCYTARNQDGKVVSIRVEFISNCEEDEE